MNDRIWIEEREFQIGQDFGVATAIGSEEPVKVIDLDEISARILDEISVRIEEELETSRPPAMLELVTLLAPKRLAEEDIGDALEIIHRLQATHAPAWKIYLKTASTVFWVSLNAFREVMGAMLGRA